MSYGAFLKKHRLASGYKSQRKLASVCNVSCATISRIEQEIQRPEVETIKQIAPFLRTTTFEELMIVSGYIDAGDLPNEVRPANSSGVELTNNKTTPLLIDGVQLTKEEVEVAVSVIRNMRDQSSNSKAAEKIRQIEYEIDHSDLGTAVKNIIAIIKE